MFAGLQNQFHNQILVSLKKYRDLRRVSTAGNDLLGLAAIDCVTALFHFREHIPEADRLTSREVSAECPDNKFVADEKNAVT